MLLDYKLERLMFWV